MPILSRFFAAILLLAALRAEGGSLDTGKRPAPARKTGAGVLIRSLAIDSALAQAGICSGDRLVAWRRERRRSEDRAPVSGRFENPFDISEVEIEISPRGTLEITLERNGRRRLATIGSQGWKVKSALSAESPDPGEGHFPLDEASLAADSLRKRGNFIAAAWTLVDTAAILTESGNPDLAHALFGQALEDARRARDPRIRARILSALAEADVARGDVASARDGLREALGIRRRIDAGSLLTAHVLSDLGRLDYESGRLAEAEAEVREALVLVDQAAPESLYAVRRLNAVAVVCEEEGKFEDAERHYDRARLLVESIAPNGIDQARTLDNLASFWNKRGDLPLAEALSRRSLAIFERLLPDSLDLAINLHTLGVLLLRRGDYQAAESLLRRDLELTEKQAPISTDLVITLNSLADVEYQRANNEQADALWRRAIDVAEKAAPESIFLAGILSSYAASLIDRGRFDEAEILLARSLSIKEHSAPGSIYLAQGLRIAARASAGLGDFPGAKALLLRAREITSSFAPGGPDDARVGEVSAAVSEMEGDLQSAEAALRTSLIWYERASPSSLDLARISHELGRVLRSEGKLGESSMEYCRAVRALDDQKRQIGGSQESKSKFAAYYGNFYRDHLELLVELGNEREAFAVSERSRARIFLSLLAERDLLFGVEVPGDLEKRRRLGEADYDRLEAEIAAASASADEAALRKKLDQLREVRSRLDHIRDETRAVAPRIASLRDPEPLDALRTASVLDPGTLLLSYSVGTTKTILFSLDSSGRLETRSLPVGEESLRQRVRRFRAFLQDPSGDDDSGSKEIERQSTALSDLLLAPAAGRISKAKRLLILPDGPLHFLPFAGLKAPGPVSGATAAAHAASPVPFHFLVEEKPVTVASSATVFAELRNRRRNHGASHLVAFGDPLYDPEGTERLRPGLRLAPLPHSRTEVERLAAVFPGSRVHLGEDATEEAAKNIEPETALLHFACHGIVDARFPLDSALALTIPNLSSPGHANGLLQAWEIFEGMRLDADLVTLSACETAVGREDAGEGLLGLTRAFQFAGARSVLASLWEVGDESTTKLMVSFYRGLGAGLSKDEALRGAQVEMIGTPLRAPFHWAGFELIGDWR